MKALETLADGWEWVTEDWIVNRTRYTDDEGWEYA